MRGRILLGLLLALCVPLASQARKMPDDIRAQVETSMLVGGTVDIDREGRATGAVLDHAEKLPAGVVQLVDAAVATWRFEPVLVDGVPADVRTGMSLRVVATPQGEDRYSIGLRGAAFGLEVPGAGALTGVRSKDMAPPRYPEGSYQQGIQGVVYVVTRIGRDGRVEDAIAEQVNLTVYGRERQMEAARRDLSKAALAAAKRWTFHPPTEGDEVDAPFWLARVPVAFMLGAPSSAPPTVGQWETYLPGPRTPVPWGDPATRSADAPDAMPAGSVGMAGNGPKLLTPLQG